jgi:hypothetical protein
VKKKLTNTVWKRLKRRVEKENLGKGLFHQMEWDCTGNRHDSECWCITETYALAERLGYRA